MPKKKTLKALIRERMKKTGESFSTARAHIVRQGHPCPSCGSPLSAILIRETFEPDEDATEGQIADYMAEMESGEFDNWAWTGRRWFCPRCEPEVASLGEAGPGDIAFEDFPVGSKAPGVDDDDLGE